MFDPYELAELRIAECEGPWPQSPENLRMLYLAAVIEAASPGYTDDCRRSAGARARTILMKLVGPSDG